MSATDVLVEILECPGHGNKAISINGYRLLGKKCCGNWKTMRRWEVPKVALERDLDYAMAINYSEEEEEEEEDVPNAIGPASVTSTNNP